MRGLLALTLIVVGHASRYDPGVFEEVERVRRMSNWDGAHVAVLDCSRVGDFVWLCYKDQCIPARVTDCAGVADGGAAWMISGGYAAELDYETSERLECLGDQIELYEPDWRFEYE
jgi:hypothetical protein